MCKKSIHSMLAVLIVCVSVPATAGVIQVAEELLVDLRAGDLEYGTGATTWTNHGSLDDFAAMGAPLVEDVDGRRAVTFFESTDYFAGPESTDGIHGDGTRSIEVWVYNGADLVDEETMVSWGRRGGGDGTNMSFNYGGHDTWGAVGHWGSPDMPWSGDHAPAPAAENWWYLVYTFDGADARLYVNAEENTVESMSLNTYGPHIIRVAAQADETGDGVQANLSFTGSIAEVRIHDGVLSPEQIANNFVSTPGVVGAGLPNPADEATDVPRDTILSWAPGPFAQTHDLYLGTVPGDVNDASRNNPIAVLVHQNQDANSYDPGRLELGQTYYWRVDEVNAVSGNPEKGSVWSFAVEPVSYAIISDQIAVSASSTGPNSDANNLINGSGLLDGQHSTESLDMWISAAFDFAPVVQFDLASPQVLDKVLIWNSNQVAEMSIGWGTKDIVLETSVDGVEWTVVDGATQLTRASGMPSYGTPDEIALNGVAAQHLRISILNSFGGFPVGIGLSEVMIYAVPVYARNPVPADGAVALSPLSEMTWRQGRQAAQSRVALDVNEAAVAGDSAASVTAQGNTVGMTALDVELSSTYFWRVDEVNDAEATTLWQGDVWNFSTAAFLTVDDFEDYSNFSPDRPFQAWIDGIGYSADEFFPVANTGNGTGAAVGHDIWSVASSHFEGDIMERFLTAEGAGQSMPVYYSGNSRADRTLSPSQDWTAAGVTTLVLFVHGDRGNASGSLYIEINGKKITHSDGNLVTKSLWTQWNIDLASAGVALNNIKDLSIGVDSSGSGVIYVDEIRLYKEAPEMPVAVDPGTIGLAAKFSLDDTLDDTSGHGLGTGTVGGGDPFYVDGIVGNALSFDGIVDFVELPVGSVMESSQSITVSIWADFSNEGDNWQRIWDFGSGEGTNPYMFLSPRTGGAGPIRFAIRSLTVAESFIESTATLASGWQHVAATIDGETMTMSLYINGSLVAQGPTGVIPSDMGNTVQNYLAKSQYAADGLYQGSVDELTIYTRTLSEGEIRYLAGDQ